MNFKIILHSGTNLSNYQQLWRLADVRRNGSYADLVESSAIQSYEKSAKKVSRYPPSKARKSSQPISKQNQL
jgi:hypothetical protein